MRLLIPIIFLASLLQVVFGVGKVLLERDLIDFSVYYQYSKLFLAGGNPYTLSPQTRIPLNYPPSSLLSFIPFTIFTQRDAQMIFTILSLIALLVSCNALLSYFGFSRPARLILLSLALQNFPTKFTLVLGQVNMVILFFIIFSFIWEQKKRYKLSGIALGLATMIKPITLPLFIYFLIRKKITVIKNGLSLLLISNGVMLLIFPYLGSYFWERIPYLIGQTATSVNLYDQSLRAFLIRVGLPGYALSIIAVLILYFAAIFNYLRRKNQSDALNSLTFFSLILAITTIGSSFTWQHHLVFLIPGFFAETLYFLKSKSALRGILLATSFVLVSYHFPDIAHPPTTNPFLISHSLMGSLLLIGLLLKH